MSSTTFTDYITPVPASWLNDVNSQTYTLKNEYYSNAGGTSDAITGTYTVTLPDATLYDGYRLTVDVGAITNATTTPTFAPTINGVAQTARTVVKFVAGAEVVLAPGDIQGIVDLRYDLTNTKWVLMNPVFASPTGSLTQNFNTKNIIAVGGGGLASNFAGGTLALLLNSTGSNNVAVGYTALRNNTTGSGNIAIGYQSLFTNDAGASNIAFGTNSLYYSTGSNNIALGTQALQNTTGNNNVAIGYQSLLNTAGGSGNTAIGYITGLGITTGVNNTIVGANVTGLAAGLSTNIILASGDGVIKAQHDGTNWALTGGMSATGRIGYATGAGGTVTQITSRTTGVTLNTATGAITLVSAAGSATPASFTVTNSTVAATDTIIVNQKSGTDLYIMSVTNVAAGSFRITFYTTGGTTTEQPVFNFTLIKGVAA